MQNKHYMKLSDGELRLELWNIVDKNEQHGQPLSYHFSIIRIADGIEVGQCNLRIGYMPTIEYGGNIGYSISEAYRGNHYAAKACILLLPLARRHRMKRVYINCSPSNKASKKTCEYLGCEYLGEFAIPNWHDSYVYGKRITCRYVINLEPDYKKRKKAPSAK